VKLRADGIELDVHATADGAIVVHHDADVRGRLISGLTFAAVRKRKLVNGEPIPTLAEALEAAGPLRVYVEVKALDAHHDTALFAALDAGPSPKHYQVHSFDHRIIQRLHRQRPDFGYGVLSAGYPLDPGAQIRAAGATALWEEGSMIDAPLVALAREAGASVIAWTVDDPARARTLAQLGVDALCTNKPDVIRKALA
jgi:glycerophosphoryl diester phosphodiesterase